MGGSSLSPTLLWGPFVSIEPSTHLGYYGQKLARTRPAHQASREHARKIVAICHPGSFFSSHKNSTHLSKSHLPSGAERSSGKINILVYVFLLSIYWNAYIYIYILMPQKKGPGIQLQQVKPPAAGVSLIRGKEAPSCSDAAGGFKWPVETPWMTLRLPDPQPKTSEELDDISEETTCNSLTSHHFTNQDDWKTNLTSQYFVY